MYGGLFGDLPAAKNSDITTTTAALTTTSANTTVGTIISTESSHEPPTINGSSTNHDDNRTVHPTTHITTTTATTTIPPTMIVPHRIRPTVLQQQQQQQQQQHIVAMRPRQPQIRKRPISNSAPPPPPPPLQSQSKEVESRSVSDLPKVESSVELFSSIKPNTVTVEETKSDSIAHYTPSESNDATTNRQQLALDDRLRILNATAMEQNDIYNPLIPNDVLVYWEQQVLRHEQEQYQVERQRLVQEQEMIRQQLEQERNSLLEQAIRAEQQQQQAVDATKVVDDMTTRATAEPKNHLPYTPPMTTTTPANEYYQKIIQQEQQRTIGRGRGNIVSNLPAWLMQKQAQQAQPPSVPLLPPKGKKI